jgi:hypothetical protein
MGAGIQGGPKPLWTNGFTVLRPGFILSGTAYAMSPGVDQACTKMTRLNFRLNYDAPVQQRDRVVVMLKVFAITALAIGTMVAAHMLIDADVIDHLRSIRW